VRAWLGFPGEGKTYAMTAWAYQARLSRPGVRVYANYGVNLPGPDARPLETPDDWAAARNGIVLLDEAHQLLRSRDWASRDGRQIVLNVLDELRKRRLVVCYTTHVGAKVDRRLRELTESVRHMTYWTAFRLFTWRETAAIEGPGYRVTLSRGFLRRQKRFDQAYDSWGILADTGEGRDETATRLRVLRRRDERSA